MARNWAICIGINNYNPRNFTPLKYARQDAERVSAFFQEMNFDKVYLFTDGSSPISADQGPPYPSEPTHGNLVTFLSDRFARPFLSTGDNVWFFFAGHGERHNSKDYLMPKDANARGDKVISALQVDEVRDWLLNSGADNVVLLLDACRNEGGRGSTGISAEQPGVITMSSCNPSEKAWEINELEQGAFTYALLEALQLPGDQSCATVERLSAYLKHRVPNLCQRYGKMPAQTPRISVDPIEKQHFILIPQFARQADIEKLKTDGFRFAFNNQLRLAEKMFIRANAAAQGKDTEILVAYAKVLNQIERMGVSAATTPTAQPGQGGATAETVSVQDAAQDDRAGTQKPETTKPSLPTFEFEVVTVNAKGEISQRKQKRTEYVREDLGNGVYLDLVQIPEGTFRMGSPESEAGRDDDEEPQHEVRISGFWMGKYPVTQAQWRSVAALPQVERDLDPDPSKFKGNSRPVESVSWEEAVEFCQRLSQHTGHEYRLPNEAEWEYACRAGAATPFHFGETITDRVANFDATLTYGDAPEGEYRQETTDVGSFPANGFGLYDMHGNVWEWCADDWHENYEGAPTDGSAWLSSGSEKMVRGGSWDDFPYGCRSANRYRYARDFQYNYLGFRVVCASS
ncbi:MAG: SUMF1/EgtB/PvdO family nonheme iron enzyme [Cyanobacteria bacterium J06638_22]